MTYKIVCQWCKRIDCAEKGDSLPQCPVEQEECADESAESIIRDILHNDQI